MWKRFRQLFQKTELPELPVLLDYKEYEALIPTVETFPYPDWEQVYSRLDSFPEEQQDQVWQDFAHIWLTRLAYRLERNYAVSRSQEFILLAPMNTRRARYLLNILEGIRTRILEILGWTSAEEGDGLYVVLVFASSRSFLEYVSQFGPDGEYRTPVGQYIPGEYGHLAVVQQENWRMESTLAYLLCHEILDKAESPNWLRTGLALHFGQVYDHGERLPAERFDSQVEVHQEYWRERGLQGFWTGVDFFSLESQDMSEQFALALTRSVLSQVKDLSGLFRAAHWSDAGGAALLDQGGRALSDWVADILGPGQWGFEPPVDWAEET